MTPSSPVSRMTLRWAPPHASFTAVMIFFCIGQITIQTLRAMIVPNITPAWMYRARPPNIPIPAGPRHSDG